MQETFHIAQLLNTFEETNSLPEPYEYWEMEVESHREANKLWREIYGDDAGPPSYLPKAQHAMSEDYQDDAKDYKDLKKKEAAGTITATEKQTMEELKNKLTSSANLP